MLKKIVNYLQIILLSILVASSNLNCAAANGMGFITRATQEDFARANFDGQCAICTETSEITDESNFYIANCQSSPLRPHIFHMNCILTSINSGQPMAHHCPICREPMINHNIDLDEEVLTACQNNDIAALQILIERGANVNAQDDDGWTALMYASIYGHLEIAQLLIDRGANVNAQNNYGKIALMYASIYGHLEVARLLIDKGANINAQDNSGWTALMYAARNGHFNIARLLIDRGTDKNIRNNIDENALSIAIQHDQHEIALLLNENDPD